MRGVGDKVCATFTTYNLLALLFGLLVAGVAGWLAADKVSFFTELKLLEVGEDGLGADTPSLVDYGAFVLVGIGAAIVVQSILGCTGTFLGCCGNRKARCCLLTYGSLVLLVIVLEIVAAVLVLHVYQDTVSDQAQSFLKSTLQSDYQQGGRSEVTRLWDLLMESRQCCGVTGYQDFEDITITIPAACCGGVSECYSNSTMLATSGCYPALVETSVPAIASSLAVVALFQLAGVVLSCCLARKVEEKREWYDSYEMRGM